MSLIQMRCHLEMRLHRGETGGHDFIIINRAHTRTHTRTRTHTHTHTLLIPGYQANLVPNSCHSVHIILYLATAVMPTDI